MKALEEKILKRGKGTSRQYFEGGFFFKSSDRC